MRHENPVIPSSRGKRVLVVDDEEEVRAAIVKILRREDLDVASAGCAADAIRAATETPFDVVLTDLVLPGEDGIALLKQIRSIRPETRVVVMTAYGDWGSYVEALGAGAVEYVMKPLKKDDLVRLVGRALGQTSLAMGGDSADPALTSKALRRGRSTH